MAKGLQQCSHPHSSDREQTPPQHTDSINIHLKRLPQPMQVTSDLTQIFNQLKCTLKLQNTSDRNSKVLAWFIIFFSSLEVNIPCKQIMPCQHAQPNTPRRVKCRVTTPDTIGSFLTPAGQCPGRERCL